jgi:hypothetical protein
VQRGGLYRARYRVRNVIGWTDYSPIGYILAAVAPSQPPQPTIVAATSLNIQIAIWPSADNGGTPITAYQLYRDNGNQGAYQQITSYDGKSTSFILNLADDSAIVVGLIYRFYVTSLN